MINPYLTFKGKCEEAFNFYKNVFQREISHMSKFKDMPQQEGMPPMPPEIGERVLHASIQLDNNTFLMGSDDAGEMAPPVVVGNNITLSITIDTQSEADRIFAALSEGGNVIMPLDNTFWGAYFGMLVDKFEINWMISFDKRD